MEDEHLVGLARSAYAIVEEELGRSAVAYDKLDVRLIDARSVGVMGDGRTYEYPVIIEIYKDKQPVVDYSLMERIGTRIPNEVKGINRVVWTTAREKKNS